MSKKQEDINNDVRLILASISDYLYSEKNEEFTRATPEAIRKSVMELSDKIIKVT